jgi:hypothetical protein
MTLMAAIVQQKEADLLISSFSTTHSPDLCNINHEKSGFLKYDNRKESAPTDSSSLYPNGVLA